MKRFERLANSGARNALQCALNGFSDSLRLDAERAEIATEGNGDMCFHRSVCEAGIEPACEVNSDRESDNPIFRDLMEEIAAKGLSQ